MRGDACNVMVRCREARWCRRGAAANGVLCWGDRWCAVVCCRVLSHILWLVECVLFVFFGGARATVRPVLRFVTRGAAPAPWPVRAVQSCVRITTTNSGGVALRAFWHLTVHVLAQLLFILTARTDTTALAPLGTVGVGRTEGSSSLEVPQCDGSLRVAQQT